MEDDAGLKDAEEEARYSPRYGGNREMTSGWDRTTRIGGGTPWTPASFSKRTPQALIEGIRLLAGKIDFSLADLPRYNSPANNKR